MADRLQFTPPHPSWRYFVALHPRLVGIVLLATVVSMACTTPTVAPDAGAATRVEAPTPPPVPLASTPQVPAAPPEPQHLTFTVPNCERPDCALTLSFSHPVVEGTEKVTFKPRLKGRFHWNSPTELTFEPAAPLTIGDRFGAGGLMRALSRTRRNVARTLSAYQPTSNSNQRSPIRGEVGWAWWLL